MSKLNRQPINGKDWAEGSVPEWVYTILERPLFSEKATRVAEQANQYVFVVRPDASKPGIKRAVEHLFKVEVEGVTTLNVKPEIKRTMRGRVRKPGFKKAYIRVKSGQTIDLADLN